MPMLTFVHMDWDKYEKRSYTDFLLSRNCGGNFQTGILASPRSTPHTNNYAIFMRIIVLIGHNIDAAERVATAFEASRKPRWRHPSGTKSTSVLFVGFLYFQRQATCQKCKTAILTKLVIRMLSFSASLRSKCGVGCLYECSSCTLPYSVGLLWTSDQLVTQADTYTTYNKHKRRISCEIRTRNRRG